MLFYDTSRYVCPCGDTTSDHPDWLPSQLRPWNLHRLPDLYFCPPCRALRCSNCADISVVCKYCPNCMVEYTASPGVTRCSKNCFECPDCASPVLVVVHDETKGKTPGKQFSFSCGHCAYQYTTKTVTKPAPLATILRHEHPAYFTELHEKYSLSHKLLQADCGKSRLNTGLSLSTLARMEQMNIGVALLDNTEAMARRVRGFEPRPVDIDADFVPKRPVLVPQGYHLVAKQAYACHACSTRLLSPVPDARLMKYVDKELAAEVVPLVTARAVEAKTDEQPAAGAPRPEHERPVETVPGECAEHMRPSAVDTSCVLNIVNPLTSPMTITVATLEHIPQRISGVAALVSVSLPVTSVVLPARREKAHVLDSIPTVFLTSSTQAARGEALARAIRREGLLRGTDAHAPFVEQSVNWASVPFTATVFETTPGNGPAAAPAPSLRLPFHVTVDTRAPSHWPGKPGLKYGFWVVCEVAGR